jgi:hypothetical protein
VKITRGSQNVLQKCNFYNKKVKISIKNGILGGAFKKKIEPLNSRAAKKVWRAACGLRAALWPCLIYTYADDTSSSCQDSVDQVVIKKLQEDAKSILEFMASNGLVVNPSKTVFMMVHNEQKDNNLPKKIKVGDHEILESKSAELLGVVMDNDQKWKIHFCGKGGLLSSLNQRLFMV